MRNPFPGLCAGLTATATFNYVFQNRTHTCLEALIVGADENTDPNDDRGQINLEVVNAGETFSYGVPIANNGGAQVFAEEGFFDRKAKKVLPKLDAATKTAIEGALRQLVDCDRILAQTAIADAGGPAKAQAHFEDGDRLRLAGDGDAIDLYKKAWQTATR